MQTLNYKRYKLNEPFNPATAEKETIHFIPVSLDPLVVRMIDVDKWGNVAEISTSVEYFFKGDADFNTVPVATGKVKYQVFVPGTYPNFKNSAGQPLIVTEQNLADYDVFLTIDNGVNANKILQEIKKPYFNNFDGAPELAVDIRQRIDSVTGENVNYKKTTTWHDGTVMTDEKVDGTIYVKISNSYYRRQFTGSIQIKWFGAKGDGITDDTAAIQAAFDFGFKTHTSIFELGSGIFNVTNTLYFPTRCGLKGSGINESIFRMTNRKDIPIIEIRELKDVPNDISNPALTNNTTYTVLTDFSVYGVNWDNINWHTPNESSVGILISNMVKVDLQRIASRGITGNGITINKVYYVKLLSVCCEGNQMSGLKVLDATSIQSLNCEFRINGKGVYLENTYAWSFINPLIETNVLQQIPVFNYGEDPATHSSIGFLAKNSMMGNMTGGYFEDQLVCLMLHDSYNITVNGTFFANNSVYQKPPDYIPSCPIYLFGGGTHSNTFKDNSYTVDMTPNANDVRIYVDVDTYGNTFEFLKKPHFDWFTTNNSWIWDNYRNNDIIQKSPKVICHASNEQFLYGKKVPLNGMFWGPTAERPAWATDGFMYLDTTLSQVIVKIGPSWIPLN